MKIHHVALAVRDIDESISWYRDIFDAHVVERYEKNDREIAHLQMGDTRLELFAPTTGALPEYRKELKSDLAVVGTKHVCLETDDLDALHKKLADKGVEFATEIDTAGFGGRYLFIKDVNGILIELYQP